MMENFYRAENSIHLAQGQQIDVETRSPTFASKWPEDVERYLPLVELVPASEGLGQKTNDAMRKYFYTGDAPIVSLKDPERKSASAWDLGQALQATIGATQFSSDSWADEHALNQDVSILEHFWDKNSKPPGYDSHYGPSGFKYYDDNAWIGISLVDAYRKFSNSADLERAKEVFDFLEFGTEGTEKLAKPGGIFWSQEPNNQYRGTVSTAGGAQLALMLYMETNDAKYLDFAKKQFDWVNEYLRSPEGLYYDGLDSDGTIHKQEYTYNQGLMLGNATLLYQVTGDTKYLEQAQAIANASLERFGGQSESAKQARVEPFNEQFTFFNAAFFKNLMTLDSVSPDPAYRKALANYSSHLSQFVDSETGVVTIDGEQTLLNQASAVQILALAEQYPPREAPV